VQNLQEGRRREEAHKEQNLFIMTNNDQKPPTMDFSFSPGSMNHCYYYYSHTVATNSENLSSTCTWKPRTEYRN
jgi:hypothetical protein